MTVVAAAARPPAFAGAFAEFQRRVFDAVRCLDVSMKLAGDRSPTVESLNNDRGRLSAFETTPCGTLTGQVEAGASLGSIDASSVADRLTRRRPWADVARARCAAAGLRRLVLDLSAPKTAGQPVAIVADLPDIDLDQGFGDLGALLSKLLVILAEELDLDAAEVHRSSSH
ncbi:MAG: hypothetical protein AAF799_45895 [Myxococcota bacterium]